MVVSLYNHYLNLRMYNEVKEEHTCSICLGVFYKPILLKKCSHIFCEMCIDDASLEMDNKKCPLCRTKFKSQDIVPHQKLEEEIVSAYPDELKEKLKSMREIKKYRLEIGNTTAFLSGPVNNKYQWTFFVRPAEGEKPLSNFADRVEIDLHPTFNPPTMMIPASEPI